MIKISVGGTLEPREIHCGDVYFTCGSGMFHYDCADCGGACCRGHGYEMNAGKETEYQLASRPAIRYFMRQVSARQNTVSTCEPACFFLTSADRCHLHESRGYATKPETCRWFPFNDFLVADRYLLVAPHHRLCPLEVMVNGTTSELSDHARLLSDMEAGSERRLEVARVAGDISIPALIRLERAVRDGIDMGVRDYGACATFQRRLTASAVGRDPAGDLSGFRATLIDLCGAGALLPGEPDRAVVALMAALTPTFRHRLLFRRSSAPGGAPALPAARVPSALLVLAVLGELARAAGMQKVTYQTLSRLLAANHRLIVMLAHLEDTVTWRRDAAVSLNLPSDATDGDRRRYLGIASAIARSSVRRPASLRSILEAHAPASERERIGFLRMVADRLAGRVRALDECDWPQQSAATVSSRVTMFALRRLSPNVLAAAAQRAARRSRRSA